ncbi:MAG TPA: hypothetical protein VNN55_11100 [bacterium]|nr:hypothetical protein [bacterium]
MATDFVAVAKERIGMAQNPAESPEAKTPRRPWEILIVGLLGLLTLAAVLLILTDLQGWV